LKVLLLKYPPSVLEFFHPQTHTHGLDTLKSMLLRAQTPEQLEEDDMGTETPADVVLKRYDFTPATIDACTIGYAKGAQHDLLDRLPPLALPADANGQDGHALVVQSKGTPAEVIAHVATYVDQLYIDHHRALGSILLGYPVSVPGVFDARFSPPIFESPKEMTQHGYLRGKTGAGKSTTMQFRITQMFQQRRGVIVMAPERSLFKNRLMPYIPTNRF
jgi:hypothetical protein